MPIPAPESGENDVGAAVTPAPTVAPRGIFGGGSRIGMRQYSWFAADWRNRQMRMDLDSPSAQSANPVSSREVSWPMVEQETHDRAGGVRRRGFVCRYAGLHCALNCCSTTLLAPWASVAVTRRVTLPLTCRSEICAAKEPALVRVRVVWRRDVPRPFRMSSVIVAGSDTVRCTVSRRPLPRSLRFTTAGRSSIETVGGVFGTTRVVVVELVVVELVVVVVGRVVVVLLVVEVVGTVVVGRVVVVLLVVEVVGTVVVGRVVVVVLVVEVVGAVVVVVLVVVVVGARVVVVEDDVDVVVDELVVELVLVVVGRVVLVVVVDGLVVVVDVVVVDVVVDAVSVSAAATASRRPKPLASSKPGAPMSTAPPVSAAFTSAGVSVGSWSRSSAATPAECGAAADVPKNAQKGGHNGNPPAFEIATPSNATRSGLARTSGVGKSIRAGPCEL